MQELIEACITEIQKALIGKEQQIRLSLCCLFSGGHLLIEDLPGMGKTTFAHALAQVMGFSYSRVQFTSDLLPADILGVSVFEKKSGQFVFHQGPIFAQVVLADEINRATPKSQSALLEAMEERQVSIEGETRQLPEPFFVIATQNPMSQAGTFPLPESQLDRFLMRISLGYPDPAAERDVLLGNSGRVQLSRVKHIVSADQLKQIQQQVVDVKPADAVLDYLQRLLTHTRQSEDFAYGLSPRAGLALLRCAQSWAFMAGRDYLIPEDVQMVLPAVVEHRLREHSDMQGRTGEALGQRLLQAVPVVV
ncbi:AAA family ATPase [Spartinivicinus poritis]|uniref:MoxR family ATPase n=1 Tax=Spartinivicinus poritis TaxID=2994640 RepID=A0ABT5U422_9GAMM|nr:MoxR family ATPase [Spartinivicinus sp. A2-2]MDE1461111.1 MoxR family ATPase [Spartinivicinus sp. A2-2]